MKRGTEFWAAHVAAAKLEAIPASQYARNHGLAVSALYYWQRKLSSNTDACAPGAASKFVAIRVADAVPEQRCILALPSGLQLSMSSLPSPEWLAALAHAVPGVR